MEKTTMLRRRAAGWWVMTTSFAAALPLAATAAPPIANLPAVPALMQCSLPAFQALNLGGVADDGGQVSFTSATLVDVSSSNPAAYCAVRGVISPGASSIVMNLPMATWTQRYVQNGCGGECGNDNLGAPMQSSGCVPVAKAVIQQFYGQPAAYAYFDGCSDGGREALMSAQRYPNDFNGITAGAPANNMDVQNTYHHANRLPDPDPGRRGLPHP